jgi:hypothetical protein
MVFGLFEHPLLAPLFIPFPNKGGFSIPSFTRFHRFSSFIIGMKFGIPDD